MSLRGGPPMDLTMLQKELLRKEKELEGLKQAMKVEGDATESLLHGLATMQEMVRGLTEGAGDVAIPPPPPPPPPRAAAPTVSAVEHDALVQRANGLAAELERVRGEAAALKKDLEAARADLLKSQKQAQEAEERAAAARGEGERRLEDAKKEAAAALEEARVRFEQQTAEAAAEAAARAKDEALLQSAEQQTAALLERMEDNKRSAEKALAEAEGRLEAEKKERQKAAKLAERLQGELRRSQAAAATLQGQLDERGGGVDAGRRRGSSIEGDAAVAALRREKERDVELIRVLRSQLAAAEGRLADRREGRAYSSGGESSAPGTAGAAAKVPPAAPVEEGGAGDIARVAALLRAEKEALQDELAAALRKTQDLLDDLQRSEDEARHWREEVAKLEQKVREHEATIEKQTKRILELRKAQQNRVAMERDVAKLRQIMKSLSKENDGLYFKLHATWYKEPPKEPVPPPHVAGQKQGGPSEAGAGAGAGPTGSASAPALLRSASGASTAAASVAMAALEAAVAALAGGEEAAEWAPEAAEAPAAPPAEEGAGAPSDGEERAEAEAAAAAGEEEKAAAAGEEEKAAAAEEEKAAAEDEAKIAEEEARAAGEAAAGEGSQGAPDDGADARQGNLAAATRRTETLLARERVARRKAEREAEAARYEAARANWDRDQERKAFAEKERGLWEARKRVEGTERKLLADAEAAGRRAAEAQQRLEELERLAATLQRRIAADQTVRLDLDRALQALAAEQQQRRYAEEDADRARRQLAAARPQLFGAGPTSPRVYPPTLPPAPRPAPAGAAGAVAAELERVRGLFGATLGLNAAVLERLEALMQARGEAPDEALEREAGQLRACAAAVAEARADLGDLLGTLADPGEPPVKPVDRQKAEAVRRLQHASTDPQLAPLFAAYGFAPPLPPLQRPGPPTAAPPPGPAPPRAPRPPGAPGRPVLRPSDLPGVAASPPASPPAGGREGEDGGALPPLPQPRAAVAQAL